MTEEGERLRHVVELGLVGGPADPLIERTCDLARTLFDVPIAYVSMIAETEGHIIAESGLARCAVPRGDTMCDVTILQDEPLVVPDTLADPRFRERGTVVGGPKLRFYAGIALSRRSGPRLGTLCIADVVPREPTAAQIVSLRKLSAIVVGQFDLHASRTELARRAGALSRKQAILNRTERFASVGGFEVDSETGQMTWSDELHRMLDLADRTAPTLAAFIDLFAPQERTRLHRTLARIGRGEPDADLKTTVARRDGDVRHLHVRFQLAGADTRGLVGTVQDITEREEALRQAQWIATHDSLTRLLNRAAFNAEIEAAIDLAEQFGKPVALVMLDVDRFKAINDTLGHDVGDHVLLAVADRLREAVGRSGVVARIGGDEFAILVSRFEAEGQLAALATDILTALRRPYLHGTMELSLRATLGVAVSRSDRSSAASLFKDADIALYNAKQDGRDGFAFFRTSMRADLDAKMNKLAMARVAVSAGRFEPYYQPKIALGSGECVGFEALLRWHHPSKGLSLPAEMGEAFADAELATAIGRGMLEKVTADMVDWRDGGLRTGPIAINAAGPEFYAGTYAQAVLGRLASLDLPADALEIEVTESVFLDHRSGLVATSLRRLAEAGLSIALDDFGTGFASLSHLKQYPVSVIKIDRSFVKDIETDPDAAAIVDVLTSLARSLGIGAVAEGVESRGQLDYLRARGCAIAQGYLFAKPMPASRVPHFLRTWASSPGPDRMLAFGG